MYALSQNDRRAWRRFDVPLAGKLFGPSSGGRDCEVLELSAGGARVQLRDYPPGGSVVLYLDRIGPIAAQVVAAQDGLLRLYFVCDEDRRRHICRVLERMAQAGQAGPMAQRLAGAYRAPSQG